MSNTPKPSDKLDNRKTTAPVADTKRMEAGSEAANRVAANNVFTQYRETKSEHTLRAHDNDLAAFADFLQTTIGVERHQLATRPDEWRNMSWGLLEAFKRQQIREGYAISTVNRRLSTVRRYARLAHKAGIIGHDAISKIRDVNGFTGKEARYINERRRDAGIPTRQKDERGQPVKKADNTRINDANLERLLTMHDMKTPQGRRDAVLMALLLEHGLRVSEAALLKVQHIDLIAGEMRFYRPKVDKMQTHRLTVRSLSALEAYYQHGDVPDDTDDLLLRASHRSGSLLKAGMSTQAITARVQKFGELIGLDNLSAHDCRHCWATRAARGGSSPFALQEGGGWNSLAMPRRYVDEQHIANDGIKLSGDD